MAKTLDDYLRERGRYTEIEGEAYVEVASPHTEDMTQQYEIISGNPHQVLDGEKPEDLLIFLACDENIEPERYAMAEADARRITRDFSLPRAQAYDHSEYGPTLCLWNTIAFESDVNRLIEALTEYERRRNPNLE